MEKKLAFTFIAMGAALWGIIGLFVTYLYQLGFTPTQVVAVRMLSAAFFLVIYVTYKNKQLFQIKLADSKYFIGTGIISIVLFNWCLFSAMEETSISIAFVLLYTAPAFVTILARILFKEALTGRKLFALTITFIGCAFVVGIFPDSNASISFYGFILGLGSGFFYALYSIFGKFALKKYDSVTVTVYTFLFAVIAIIPFSGLGSVLPLFMTVEVWIYTIGLGFLSTMLAFLLYTNGLKYVESSQASIIATIEPVIASLTSFLVFDERLSFWQYAGIFLVLFAVIIVQKSAKKTRYPETVSRSSSL